MNYDHLSCLPCSCLDITMLNTAEIRDYYQIGITTRLGRITIDLHDDRQRINASL